jgi:hypothetical protein
MAADPTRKRIPAFLDALVSCSVALSLIGAVFGGMSIGEYLSKSFRDLDTVGLFLGIVILISVPAAHLGLAFYLERFLPGDVRWPRRAMVVLQVPAVIALWTATMMSPFVAALCISACAGSANAIIWLVACGYLPGIKALLGRLTAVDSEQARWRRRFALIHFFVAAVLGYSLLSDTPLPGQASPDVFSLVVFLFVGVGAGAFSVLAVFLAQSMIGRLVYALPVAVVATSPVWTPLRQGTPLPSSVVLTLIMAGGSVLLGWLLSVGILRRLRSESPDGSVAPTTDEVDASSDE